MTVYVEFHLDTRTSKETLEIVSPFDNRGKAADKIKSSLEETSKSSSAMMQVRDSESGDYVMINTMKLASVKVVERE